MTRVYLDSNIIIAKIAGFENNSKQAQLANNIFDKIKNSNEIEAVVSHLAMIEVMSVLKNRIGQDTVKLSKVENKTDFIINDSNDKYNQILAELLHMKDKIIFQSDKKIDFNQLLIDSQTILMSIKGKIKNITYCKKCNTGGINATSYKSLASYDAFHVLLAKQMDCDEFWTFDKDFEEILNHKLIPSLEIIIYK